MDNLPDSILESCIIPFLPIKDAVRTGLISRRWRHLWRHSILTSRNLELDFANVLTYRASGYYMKKFVKKYLNAYQGEKVDSLKLKHISFVDPQFTRFLDHCVKFAIAKGVEEIQLSFDDDDITTCGILQVSSLKHLSLRNCTLSGFDFEGLSNLRSLSLSSSTVDSTSIASLFSKCLFLESLKCLACSHGRHLRIAGERLRHLKLWGCMGKIEISAPNLVSLEYEGDFTSITFVKPSPLLARIVNKVKTLHLIPSSLPRMASSAPELKTLLLQYGNYCDDILPRISSNKIFRKLKQLTVNLWQPCDSEKFDNLRDLLKAAPLLEEFELAIIRPLETNEQFIGVHGFEMSYKWALILGSSTHYHLRKVKLHGFRGTDYEMQFAICILKSAAKLETLVINPAGLYYHVDLAEWFNLRDRWETWDASSSLAKFREDMVVVEEKLKQNKTNARLIIENDY